ncbi:epoxyqueuosine reductase [Tautonia rosea]|uniref:epoxyqueuosine reductase n=1 Tax=Tautonia rosea TaxID=2728037 RepID=UPI0019D19D5C|nr:4Fe-4S binding protein [Tautonia rosea]
MTRLEQHPTVVAIGRMPRRPSGLARLDAAELRRICLEAGADDVGFVAIDRPELDAERSDVLRVYPATRTVIALVCRMTPEAVRSPARNMANQEFHATGDEVNDTARRIVRELAGLGVRGLNPPMAFPMEMDRFPEKTWSLSLKPLAVAAGLGQMGLHRNVIHPRFGSFILLGAVFIDTEVTEQGRAIDYNPCVTCKLCVAACPVGAISSDGAFDFSSCYSHNYREFMGGFTEWVETVAESGSGKAYRAKVSDGESASMWQSLAYGPNYKAAYCLAVCPAGEDVIGPFLDDRSGFLNDIVKPLQAKEETIYVQPNSDAEAYVARRFPHKRTSRVGAVLRPNSVGLFIRFMRNVFQRGQSRGLAATYHFRFTGNERAECTVIIRDQSIEVLDGCVGQPDLRVTTDSASWLRFLRKEISIVWLLLTLRVRLRGDPRLLIAFGRCFP